jgi:hypothetical protein
LKVLLLVRLVLAIGVVTLPKSALADACAHSFELRLGQEGPWPAHGRTKRDTTCKSWFLSRSGSVVYKRLFRVENAQHGSVGLQQGGFFSYTPNQGYVGQDRFALRVCGTVDGKDGCANLIFNMTVVP